MKMIIGAMVLFFLIHTSCSILNSSSRQRRVGIDESHLLVEIEGDIALNEALSAPKSTIRQISEGARGKVVVVTVPDGSYSDFVAGLKGLPQVLSVWPVYLYESQESLPSIVEGNTTKQLDDHHDMIQTSKAWDISRGKGVVVAVTDDGVDYNHQDLRSSIWNNQAELGVDQSGIDKNGNGIDDDANGFIDDYRGWDVIRHDNDPKPEYFFYRHGTFIAGLIAGQGLKSDGVEGVAPDAKIMPVKFIVGSMWSSLDVYNAYKYATDNGARIINTSYDIDIFSGDQVFLEALDYAYNRGVLVINSAGNAGTENSSRQNLDKLLLVGATGSAGNAGKIAQGSNFGTGIDLMAPSLAYSSVPNNKYALLNGTSFSAALVSGAAALIWSEHPQYTRDQVVATITGSAVDLEKDNPGFEGKMGSGRLNAFQAVLGAAKPPRISAIHAEDRSLQIDVMLRGTLDPHELNVSHVKVLDDAGMPVPVLQVRPYFYGANQISIDLSEPLPNGQYTLRLEGVTDPFGQLIEGSDQQSGILLQQFTVD